MNKDFTSILIMAVIIFIIGLAVLFIFKFWWLIIIAVILAVVWYYYRKIKRKVRNLKEKGQNE